VEERTPEEVSGPQLRSEGSELAEAGRYREALAKWEHALLLTPDDPLLFELKAQVRIRRVPCAVPCAVCCDAVVRGGGTLRPCVTHCPTGADGGGKVVGGRARRHPRHRTRPPLGRCATPPCPLRFGPPHDAV
jgi:hypothetical protein